MDGPNSPVRVGVLGASSIAWRRMLPVLSDLPGATLVAVASRSADKAARFAEEFGCSAVHGYENLVDRPDIDAVYVSVPNGLHLRWVSCLLSQDKHVLAEKPLTTSVADTTDLLRTADKRGLVLRENITFVHHGLHRRVAELVDAGRIGELRHVDAAFCFPPLAPTDVRYDPALGGGALLDAGIYPVRLAQYFLGDSLVVAGSVLRCGDTGVDVAGSAVLAAGTGQTATVTFGFEHGYGSYYTLWGSAGRLSVDRAFTPPATWSPVVRIVGQDHAEERTLPAEHQFAASAAAFVAAVRTARDGGTDADHDAVARTTTHTAELLARIGEDAHRTGGGGRAGGHRR
jgi:NDP-hexose-3-ketoreductase